MREWFFEDQTNSDHVKKETRQFCLYTCIRQGILFSFSMFNFLWYVDFFSHFSQASLKDDVRRDEEWETSIELKLMKPLLQSENVRYFLQFSYDYK